MSNNRNTTNSAGSSKSPPPLMHTPQTSNQLQYLQSTYDFKTLKSTLNNIAITPSSSSNEEDNMRQGPTIRFTVIICHV